MKLCIVLGTRPEILKLYWIIKECETSWLDYYVIHTGQHYSDNMSKNFFKELWLPRENINLAINEPNRLTRFSLIQKYLEACWTKYRPDMVIVQWDTDSAMIGGLSAKLMGIKVAHIEAWIRSNSDIPEEYNRRILDQISDLLFVPTIRDFKRLEKESINWHMVLSWNTICDCVKDMVKNIYEPKNYIYMTLHRNTNVDNEDKLKNIITQVKGLKRRVIFSCHPRTKKMLEEFDIDTWSIIVIEPQSYKDNLNYMNNSSLIITDSWGIQEEACILWKKCVIIRDSTERPYDWSILRDHKLKDSIDYLETLSTVWDNIFNPNNYSNISKHILKSILINAN